MNGNNDNVKGLEAGKAKANESFEMFVNQGWRDAYVLAAVSDEILVEYEMPQGSTVMLVLDAESFQVKRNCSYKSCPKYWLKAIEENGKGARKMNGNNDRYEALEAELKLMKNKAAGYDEKVRQEQQSAYDADSNINWKAVCDYAAEAQGFRENAKRVQQELNEMDSAAIEAGLKALTEKLQYRLTWGYIGNCGLGFDDRSWCVFGPHKQLGTSSNWFGHVGTDGIKQVREALEAGQVETWALAHKKAYERMNGTSSTLDPTLEQAVEVLRVKLPMTAGLGTYIFDDSERNGPVRMLQAAFPNAAYHSLWCLAKPATVAVLNERADLNQVETTAPTIDLEPPQPSQADYDRLKAQVKQLTEELSLSKDIAKGAAYYKAKAEDLTEKNAALCEGIADQVDGVYSQATLEAHLAEAEEKAMKALAGYKFQMYGYWAAIWVHLNKLDNVKRPSPFTQQVKLTRAIIEDLENRE